MKGDGRERRTKREEEGEERRDVARFPHQGMHQEGNGQPDSLSLSIAWLGKIKKFQSESMTHAPCPLIKKEKKNEEEEVEEFH